MTNRPGSDWFEQFEAQLRGAPPHEADAVRPDDRLGDIRAAVSPTRRRSGAWAPIAAAAAVAAIVVAAWIGGARNRATAHPGDLVDRRTGEPDAEYRAVHERNRIPLH
jgi:hypothetical protein